MNDSPPYPLLITSILLLKYSPMRCDNEPAVAAWVMESPLKSALSYHLELTKRTTASMKAELDILKGYVKNEDGKKP